MSKCSWTPFQWTTDNNGTMHLSPTDDMVQVHLSNDCSTQHIIKTDKPSDAVWLLGVHIAADDNYQKELTTLQHHQNKYAQFLIHMLLSQREAKTIHQQCYLPTVMHWLHATSIPPQLIVDTQKHFTSLFLSQLGYSCNMPRSVLFAPELARGVSLCNLGVEQGIQQVLHLIQHLCANTTTNGKLYLQWQMTVINFCQA